MDCTKWWHECDENGTTSRVCTYLHECGTTLNKPNETKKCYFVCIEDWDCSSWSDCSNGNQTRNCTDLNNCSINITPTLTKTCECDKGYLFEYRCIEGRMIERLYQYADCTTEWLMFEVCKTFEYCEPEMLYCKEKTCSEIGGVICEPPNVCLYNDLESVFDTDFCCLSNCTIS